MTGIEAAVVFLIAWFARKAGRVGRWVDGMADEVLDAYLKRLHSVVTARLPEDPALEQLAIEAAETGDATASTRTIVQRTLVRIAGEDATFAAELNDALEPLRARGPSVDNSVTFSGGVKSDNFGIAIGGVSGGNVAVQRPDPQKPNRK